MQRSGAIEPSLRRSGRFFVENNDGPHFRYYKGTTFDRIALYLQRQEVADLPTWQAGEPCRSVRFQLGYFPDLHRESETLSGDELQRHFVPAEMTIRRQRSRFYLPLMRASWRRAAKRKPTQWEILEGAR